MNSRFHLLPCRNLQGTMRHIDKTDSEPTPNRPEFCFTYTNVYEREVPSHKTTPLGKSLNLGPWALASANALALALALPCAWPNVAVLWALWGSVHWEGPADQIKVTCT